MSLKKKEMAARASVHQMDELRVLILEDSSADFELIEKELKRSGFRVESLRVKSRTAFIDAMKKFKPELILADYALPNFDAPSALKLVREKHPWIPFIIVTGSVSEEVAVACMKQGADDYLLKDRLTRLGEAVRQSLDRSRLRKEKAEADEALRVSEEKYRIFVENANDIIYSLTLDGLFSYVSPTWTRILGHEIREVVDHPFRPFVHPLDFPACLDFFEKTIVMGEKRAGVEYRVRHKDGTWRWHTTNASPIRDGSGKVVAGMGIARDITERKRGEERLAESERKYRELVENANSIILHWTKDGRITFLNEFGLRFFGYSPEEIIGRLITDTIVPPIDDSGRDMRKLMDRIRADPIAFERNVNENVRRNGDHVWIDWTNRIVQGDRGEVIEILSIGTDITERKKVESALIESEERFRSLYENATIGMYRTTPDGRILIANPSLVRMLGFETFESLAQHNLEQEGFEPEYPRSEFRSLIEAQGEVKSLESAWKRRDGKPIFVRESARVIRDEHGKILYYEGTVEDITERKHVEDALRISENKFRSMAEHLNDFIALTDRAGIVMYASPVSARLFGMSPEEMTGRHFTDFLEDASIPMAMAAFQFAFEKGVNSTNLELRMKRKDGSTFIGELNGSPYDLTSQQGTLVAIRDITERKRAEEQIRVSLQEKEVLLKEIHHRVKNNLQVISGLLTLQSEQVNDERLQRVIRESQNRIWTMALIHQTLYQSGNLADIDMADYIRTLAGNLLSSHARGAVPPTVSFDLAPVRLVIDRAIPLALIINELVTNAMKHAFPDKSPGEIRIALRGCSDRPQSVIACSTGTSLTAYELTVADNGNGLPAGFDLKNQKSLGLQLVAMLTTQLGGSLAIEQGNGTVFRVTFPNDEKSKPKH